MGLGLDVLPLDHFLEPIEVAIGPLGYIIIGVVGLVQSLSQLGQSVSIHGLLFSGGTRPRVHHQVDFVESVDVRPVRSTLVRLPRCHVRELQVKRASRLFRAPRNCSISMRYFDIFTLELFYDLISCQRFHGLIYLRNEVVIIWIEQIRLSSLILHESRWSLSHILICIILGSLGPF